MIKSLLNPSCIYNRVERSESIISFANYGNILILPLTYEVRDFQAYETDLNTSINFEGV